MIFKAKPDPMTDSALPRVLIVAANPLSRIGLAALCARHGLLSVGESAPSGDLNTEIARARPDAVIWDVEWAADAEALGATARSVPILALIPEVGIAGEVWAAGAAGLLLKNAAGEMVAAAVTALMARLTVVDPVVAGAVFPARPRPPEEDLTAREREVLSLVAEGLPNKAIALRLGISDHTVKFHINAILSKLGVQSRTEAVVRAVRLGVLVL